MTDAIKALTAAITGPYELIWLEDGAPPLATGLPLNTAFEWLLACAEIEPRWERIDGAMTLIASYEGPYPTTSKSPDDQQAKREIMEAALKHAWGEYAVERADDAAVAG